MSAYEDIAGRETALTLRKVVDISDHLLPEKMKSRPWEWVSHGTTLLCSDEQLCAYMVAYGEMHEMKCRAAFQNFPFDKLLTNFEIVDWGCGQGLASLVLLEMLGERDKEHLVKRVTLIEPSTAALARAKFNLCQRVNGRAEVVAMHRYLPSYDETTKEREVTAFDCHYTTVVHIFSNILDIPEINIERLSQIVAQSGRHSYVVCVGPQNNNSWRIDAFAGYFHYKDSDVFSAINQKDFAHSTRTNHMVTCRTRCFEYFCDKTPWNGFSSYEGEQTLDAHAEYINDYSSTHALFKDEFPASLLTAYEFIHNQIESGDQLFLRPIINGDQPDIVLFRPAVGIVIFKVEEELPCEEEPTTDDTAPSDADAVKQRNAEKGRAAIATVESYANRFIFQHVPALAGKVAENGHYRKLIKTAVVFAHNGQNEVDAYFPVFQDKQRAQDGQRAQNKQRTYTLSLKTLRQANLAHLLEIDEANHDITSALAQALLDAILPRWHSYREGRPSFLNKQQRELAVSRAKEHRKIKGVAGSGKTQVLVSRAINAMVRTGQTVLILTYNIALRNYIKYRMNDVAADFSWKNVVICNYHEFIRSQILNEEADGSNWLEPYESIEYFDSYSTTKYAAIFIDEVQDWKENWLHIIHDHFLAEDGEFVVFGDKAQNIFHRKTGDDGEPTIPYIQGRWNESLNKSERFLNGKIFNLAQAFGAHFFNWAEGTLQFEDTEHSIEYGYTERETPIAKCAKWIQDIVRRYGLDDSQTIVLSSRIDFARRTEQSYRKITQKTTTTTFARQELCDTIREKVYNPEKAEREIESYNRPARIGFTMGTDILKFSTISSFKGWEADNVVLFIQDEIDHSELPHPESSNNKEESRRIVPEIIYTAITRARKRLFIINLGNTFYDAFFRNYFQGKESKQ